MINKESTINLRNDSIEQTIKSSSTISELH